jgi:hypothetical protein
MEVCAIPGPKIRTWATQSFRASQTWATPTRETTDLSLPLLNWSPEPNGRLLDHRNLGPFAQPYDEPRRQLLHREQ